jgi:hypothetical protein
MTWWLLLLSSRWSTIMVVTGRDREIIVVLFISR